MREKAKFVTKNKERDAFYAQIDKLSNKPENDNKRETIEEN